MTGQLLRFAIVGGVNTLLGFSIIVGLSHGLGVNDYLANLAGFGLGACCSYLLNKSFTFGSRKRHRDAVPAFVVLIAICLAANMAILALALRSLDWTSVPAQAVAVMAYNVLFFLGSRLIVFKD